MRHRSFSGKFAKKSPPPWPARVKTWFTQPHEAKLTVPNWSRHKWAALTVIIVLSGLLVTDHVLKTPGQPSPIFNQDPNTIIWKATDPNTNGGEFNFNGFTYQTNCKGSINCLTSFNSNSGSFFRSGSSTNGSSITINVVTGDIIVVTSQHYNTQTISDTQSNTFTNQIEKSAACCNGFTGISTIWTTTASSTGSDTISFAGAQDATYQATASAYGNIVSINGTTFLVLTAQSNVGSDSVTFNNVGASDFVVQGQGAYFGGASPFTQAACSANGIIIGQGDNNSPNAGHTSGIGIRNFGNSTGGGGTVAYCISWNAAGSCGTGGCTVIHTAIHLNGKSGSPLPSVALTKSSIGDLSIAASKALGLNFTWAATNPNTIFGMFLTTNQTIPLTKSWSPYNDTNVAYLQQLRCAANCNVAVENWDVKVYSLRTLGQGHNIQGEDSGCSSTGSASSCFLTNNLNLLGNAGAFNYNLNLLNFTGNTQPSGTCSFSGGVFGGPGCSWTATGLLPAGSPSVNTNIGLPHFAFESQQYYLGFFTLQGTTQVQFGFQNLNIYTYNTGVAAAAPPNIDTGGFFGPIVKALIELGVWILGNIIRYFAFLAQLTIAALDIVGRTLGFGNIGTQAQSFFVAVGDYIINVVAPVFAQLVSIFQFAKNIVGALSNVWTLFWNGLSAWMAAIIGVLSFITIVWDAFWSRGGVTANLLLFFDFLWGMWKVYEGGTEEFKQWVDFNYKTMMSIFHLSDWFYDQSLKAILRIKGIFHPTAGSA